MHKNKGFSLLELIIAVGILAIGLVGVLQIFPVGLRASHQAGMLTKAGFLGKNKLEEIKMEGFDVIAERPPRIPLSGKEGDFDWKIDIEEVDLDGVKSSDNIRKVTLTVSWIERDRTKSKDFVTYVTRQ